MSAARLGHGRGPYRRLMTSAVALVGAGALVAGCTSNEPENQNSGDSNNAASSNDESGDTVVIGFSAPAADHGWMAGITEAARAEAEKYDDVELRVAEGTNDVSAQISQVETFINDGVDAIVLLPFDGAAMTPVALQAMEAGIPVINVDREFNDPAASRATYATVTMSAWTFTAELPSGAAVPVEASAGTSANHSHLEDTCAQRAPNGACSP